MSWYDSLWIWYELTELKWTISNWLVISYYEYDYEYGYEYDYEYDWLSSE